MGRRLATFTETDVRRAIKAVQAAGLPVGAVEIGKDGAIRVVTATPESKPVDAEPEWTF